MAKKRMGRPSKHKTRRDYLEVRLDTEEKQTFKEAADLVGLTFSAWVGERLRLVARRELEKAIKPVAFLEKYSPFQGVSP